MVFIPLPERGGEKEGGGGAVGSERVRLEGKNASRRRWNLNALVVLLLVLRTLLPAHRGNKP